MKELKLDLPQFCYLLTLVGADLKKCKNCNVRCSGLTKEQCESYKHVKKQVFELLKKA